jgi:hypothetical protein
MAACAKDRKPPMSMNDRQTSGYLGMTFALGLTSPTTMPHPAMAASLVIGGAGR